ncbi:hypothetical protein Tco_1409732, partial [Tanacetum coccineum]
DPQLQQQDIAIWLALQMKFKRNIVLQTTCKNPAVCPRDQDDPYDDAHLEGENSNQEQDDDFDFWTDSYASDDDEIPTKQVSQYIMEEVSLTIDEAKLRKIADEMLRQRCTSGDEHQYHNDHMKNFLKSDIVWETIIFNDDDIEERTSRWVNKCVKKFNPYARYGVEHGKNPHAKIFYIRKQKEPGKPKEEIYSNSKIVQVIKTYWELGHEYKFITEIVARRANDCIVSIIEPDYKNLNKNDNEDIYLLIMNGKNSKKKKRVLRHSEIHKFCDATLNRVIEGLKSYNNDVKYEYVQKDLTKDETKYLKLFEEEIEERLKHRRQMRRWQILWVELNVNDKDDLLRRHTPKVSSDDNEMVEVKVLMDLADNEHVVVGKESARNVEWVKISMRKVHALLEKGICCSKIMNMLLLAKRVPEMLNGLRSPCERPWLSEVEGFNLLNHDTGRILTAESQLKVIDSSINFIDSSVCDYDSVDESLVSSTLHPLLAKLAGSKHFDEKKGIIFNSNQEVEMIAPRVRDVYVLDMTSSS